MRFFETCRVGGKCAKEDYLQKKLPIFIFINNFVKITIAKISRGYSYKTT